MLPRSRLVVATTAWRSLVGKGGTCNNISLGRFPSTQHKNHVCRTSCRFSSSVVVAENELEHHHRHHHGKNPTQQVQRSDQHHDLEGLPQKHMEVSAKDFAMGCSILHQIALGISPSLLEPILKDMPSMVNFRDYDRRTPLHIAASEGHAELCELLLNYGAKINRSDRWGGSPLDDAYRHRHAAVIQLLQQRGGKFGSPSQANNLMSAASEGDIEEVKALLEYGNVNVSVGDYDRRTALHLAAGEGHTEIVRMLCENGADVNARDRSGKRPLDEAKSGSHKDCVHLLEKHGARLGSPELCSSQEALLDLMHMYGQVRDGQVTLDLHDVRNMLKAVGENPTDEVIEKLFAVADVDQNGLIDSEEFISHSEMFLSGRPARIILVVGGPGSGKGLLCERLVKECNVVHLSSGELLRDEVAQGTGTYQHFDCSCNTWQWKAEFFSSWLHILTVELGKHVEEIMKSGGLVSSAIMVTLMQKRMKNHPGKRILLDGFPRSQENARDLVTLCGRPELALHLMCDDTVMLERIMKRALSGERTDDNFQTGIQRIRNYHKYHSLTLEFLRSEHVPIVNLDCSTTPDGVWEQLRSIGRLMRSTVKLKTSSSSPSLVEATSSKA